MRSTSSGIVVEACVGLHFGQATAMTSMRRALAMTRRQILSHVAAETQSGCLLWLGMT